MSQYYASILLYQFRCVRRSDADQTTKSSETIWAVGLLDQMSPLLYYQRDVCSGARGGQRGSRGAGALCRVERTARRVDQDGLAAAAAVHKEEQQEETKHRRQLWL